MPKLINPPIQLYPTSNSQFQTCQQLAAGLEISGLRGTKVSVGLWFKSLRNREAQPDRDICPKSCRSTHVITFPVQYSNPKSHTSFVSPHLYYLSLGFVKTVPLPTQLQHGDPPATAQCFDFSHSLTRRSVSNYRDGGVSIQERDGGRNCPTRQGSTDPQRSFSQKQNLAHSINGPNRPTQPTLSVNPKQFLGLF